MGKIFDLFMENPYWKSVYEKSPSEECKEYYRIMFEYFSFETDEEDEAGLERANDRLMDLMLTREDAEYIMVSTENPIARHHYKSIITELFDGEEADTVSASMFKGEIRNPGYVPKSSNNNCNRLLP